MARGLGRIFARAESISISLLCLVLVEIQADPSWAFGRRSSTARARTRSSRCSFLKNIVCTADGLKALDADAPLGVPAVKSLADEMSAANPLIKVTYENALNGVMMPNIPQMGKFWSSMKAAFEISTNGEATPEAALEGRQKQYGEIGVKGLPIRQILVVLLAIPALALSFFIYQTGNFYVALALLVVTCLGVYIYLSPSANTFRYLFPGFLGFGLFVIFPIVYTILSVSPKYSSQNLLTFDRALALFRQETFAVDTAASYKYTLYAQDNGQYVLYLEDEKDPTKRFASEPFNLEAHGKSKGRARTR